MPSNQTPNYQLSQWEAGDRVQRTDFNADNAKIDAALAGKAEKSALLALESMVGSKGNCQIETGSYQGDGKVGRVITITTSFRPKAILMAGRFTVCMVQGAPAYNISTDGKLYTVPLTWSGNSVSWRAASDNQGTGFNNTDTIYYVALG